MRLLVVLGIATSACGYDDGELPADSSPGPGSTADRRIPGPGSGDACDNGVDDDCDGLIDFAGGDPGCTSASDGDERGPGALCDDGLDNDGDGLVDYVDPTCSDAAGDPGCTGASDTTERSTPGPPL